MKFTLIIVWPCFCVREIGGREEGKWRELESKLGTFVNESLMKGAEVFQWPQTHKQNLVETEK